MPVHSPNRGTSLLIACLCLATGLSVGLLADRWFVMASVSANPAESSREQLIKEMSSRNDAVFALSDRMAKVAQLTNPSVVHIQSERHTRRGLVEETGSGAIVVSERRQGAFVVTNRHVVDGTELDRIQVSLFDGRVVNPTWIRSDRNTDLAVMFLDVKGLQPARWGDSSECQIGNIVLAVGSPFGLSQTITYGIVSAKGRRALELGPNSDVLNQDFLQTDAAINPGNSGGPLINLQGEVIGINTAIASNSGGNEGVGFSIPSNLVRKVMEELLEYGRVQRAYLGVKLDSNFDAATAARLKLDRPQGARVVEIYPNTPAERARLRADDVVIRFNNEIVQDENHLINLVSLAPLNKEIETVLIREGRKMTLPVVLSDREELQQRAVAPEDPSKGYPIQDLGLTVHQLDAETAGSLGYPTGSTGLLVVKIEPGSQLDSKLRRYDLIEEAARTPLNSVGDLQQVLEERNRETIVLKVKRKGPNGIETHMLVLK